MLEELLLEELDAILILELPCLSDKLKKLEGQAPVPNPCTRPGCLGPNTFPIASFGATNILEATPTQEARS